MKVKENHQVRNKAAHIAVGVDTDGIKHVLGIWVQTSEGAKFWAGVLAELRNSRAGPLRPEPTRCAAPSTARGPRPPEAMSSSPHHRH